jgi:glycerol kinase
MTVRRAEDRVVLALDQGTTSSRAVVVDHDGRIVGAAQREIAQTYPQPGWVEQDPLELWASQRETALEALERSSRSAADVAAIGITNQRETTIVWERATGVPVGPAIVWQDRRTADDCRALHEAGAEPLVRARTGLVLDPYFSGTKLSWILERMADGVGRARRGELAFGTVDSWLVWNLTGGRLHVTDATNASRTLLYDIHTGRWDDELLEQIGVPHQVLPVVCDSSGVLGETEAGLFGAPIPIAALCGDQQAALFGQACDAAGMTKVTYGTGCFLLMHTGAAPVASRHGLLTTVALQRDGRRTYALEGSVFAGGAVITWLRDSLGVLESAAESGELAVRVGAGEGGVFVPALAGLGAPHWDPRARGALFGLSLGTTRAHLARAALEGIAFQVADLVAAVGADSGLTPAEVRADGGVSANDLLLQLQADVLGVPVTRAAQPESTALGAAYLAGLAVGFWRDTTEVECLWRAARRFEPDLGVDRAGLMAAWRRAVAAVRSVGS